MTDKLIKKIFEDSEKAELMEAIHETLPKCHRIIVCVEWAEEESKNSKFQYYQFGFTQAYEVLGFLELIGELIREDDVRMVSGED